MEIYVVFSKLWLCASGSHKALVEGIDSESLVMEPDDDEDRREVKQQGHPLVVES